MIDVVDANDLSYEVFCEKYMVKNVPVRILNVTSAWRANKLWKNTSGGINFKYLRQRYGQYVAPVSSSK
jgi:hypothetical protein